MKSRLQLTFSSLTVKEPITYRLIKDYNIKVNILKANIDFNLKGSLLIEIETSSKMLSEIFKYFDSLNINYDFVPDSITIDEKKCTECGLCTSVCGINALLLNPISWDLEFNSEKCLGCMSCVSVCPSQAITNNLK